MQTQRIEDLTNARRRDFLATQRAKGAERVENDRVDFTRIADTVVDGRVVPACLYEAKVLGVTVDISPSFAKLERECYRANGIAHPVEVFRTTIKTGYRSHVATWDFRRERA